MLMGVTYVLVGLAASIAFHEAAHLLTARLFGVAVTDAYLGFGPKAWSRSIGNTTYGVRWVLLGGYVKLGSSQTKNVRLWDGSDIPKEQTLEAAPMWQQVIIYTAGVITNLLFAVLLFWVVATVQGETTPTTVIDRVVEGTAAATTGLQPGDQLLSIGGEPIVAWSDVGVALSDKPNQRVDIVAIRNDQVVFFPDVKLGVLQGSGFLGVSPFTVTNPFTVSRAVAWAAEATYFTAKGTLQVIGQVLNPGNLLKFFDQPDQPPETGVFTVAPPENRPLSIVGALRLSGGMDWDSLLLMIAALNVSLAMLNVLPLLPFDGGRATLAVWEKIAKRPMSDAVAATMTVAVVGWLLVVTVMIVALDIVAPVRL